MILFDDSFLLLGKDFNVSDTITIKNPTVKEIIEFGEVKYYQLVSAVVSKPSDYKIQLSDLGVDFESISNFDFLFLQTRNLCVMDSNILFGDLDFSKMDLYVNTSTQEKYFGYDGIFIDELTHRVITDFIRKINGIPDKKPEKYANEEVKRYIMDIERYKLKYAKKEPFKSMLIPIISALVNSVECSYNYDTIFSLKISQIHDAILRISRIKNYNNIMRGLYSGTISGKDINQEEISWLA